jgi:hypothetical protein
MTATKTPALSADLIAGLKRLKLAEVRAIAPEVLHTAKTQRWAPEKVLRTLVEAEIAARDESNARGRLRAAGFPVAKTLDEFNVSLSSVAQATFDYLGSLEWITATENLCLVGPAGTGKSHLLVALGHTAIRRLGRARPRALRAEQSPDVRQAVSDGDATRSSWPSQPEVPRAAAGRAASREAPRQRCGALLGCRGRQAGRRSRSSQRLRARPPCRRPRPASP